MIAVIFDVFSPYIWARLDAISKRVPVMGIELYSRCLDYAWEPARGSGRVSRITLLPDQDDNGADSAVLAKKLADALAGCELEAVAIPGWSSQGALIALRWCMANHVPVVVMSESTQCDEVRVPWKEAIKRRVVRLCSAGLVGGSPHREYIRKLGMADDRVFEGYDAVDNHYFEKNAAAIRSRKSEVRGQRGLPEKYFMASARFVDKKNLPLLIEAYARYRDSWGKSKDPQKEPWDLVLLGDGPLRGTLSAQVSRLNLHGHVLMPGFKQYPELPAYYGLASVFVHASTTEQWGLVVNEAMASGLPVLVSNRCGCASDLVKGGVNGFTFDPHNVEELAQLMLKVSSGGVDLAAMGDASRGIVGNWGPERFAQGLEMAVTSARAVGPVSPTLLQALVTKMLVRYRSAS